MWTFPMCGGARSAARAVALVSLLLAPLSAIGPSPALGQGAGPIDPGAGAWRTWVLGTGREMRLTAPPDDRSTAAELEQVKSLAEQRDASALERIRYWDALSPSHRWNEHAHRPRSARQHLDAGRLPELRHAERGAARRDDCRLGFQVCPPARAPGRARPGAGDRGDHAPEPLVSVRALRRRGRRRGRARPPLPKGRRTPERGRGGSGPHACPGGRRVPERHARRARAGPGRRRPRDRPHEARRAEVGGHGAGRRRPLEGHESRRDRRGSLADLPADLTQPVPPGRSTGSGLPRARRRAGRGEELQAHAADEQPQPTTGSSADGDRRVRTTCSAGSSASA